MTAISQLQPQALWQWFDQICAIPHPSKHEQALSAHIQAWAKDKQLDIVEDKVGNLIIKKPATLGMENRKVVALQAHIDMVPQKNADTNHDFEKDPIIPYIDGEWVKATGTTLGSDNGIGMASALAILGSDDIAHGPLEVLLTIDEEAGMTGAFGLEAGYLDAEVLINTDSEQEGEIYMGCAGGVDAQFSVPMVWQSPEQSNSTYTLTLSGLKGGHSGVNIHLGRGNANKLLARFLFNYADELAIELTNFTGGSLRNAIPREANVSFMLPGENVPQLEALMIEYQSLIRQELAITDPLMLLELTEIPAATQVMSEDAQNMLIDLLNACPNGVIRMSDEVIGVTETSLNVGVINTENESVEVICLIRSLLDSGREEVEGVLTSLANLAGIEIELSGAYPGWKPDSSSPVMALVRETYDDIYNKEPVIMVIHAGLECGLFKKPYPEMDMVSIGPTIRYPHSPDEKVLIKTVEQYYKLLLAVLERIPEKG
ncbi:aminoacyl-histidine dipeptidase [Shewanella sp. D64]|uniref:aminoacyl-histidine dipeptidase n=1 Tax=unclassified Shewanella TaxID=196818 RepID=UPI0022BA2664|nr:MULTISPECIES: aminoacyl-histidine dipeptidase [unclassified Shewanella]MEC4728561.1 aminoacyl-histidine dipeptidase [Shewanella sp. D64]MEC4740565.1 aminoacyl-histidine dipeptidase [Shewanella sp. E94]WBJ94243.1 aminoacyl-histidine dipeptidase [Shewanella sp. MTB7]